MRLGDLSMETKCPSSVFAGLGSQRPWAVKSLDQITNLNTGMLNDAQSIQFELEDKIEMIERTF